MNELEGGSGKAPALSLPVIAGSYPILNQIVNAESKKRIIIRAQKALRNGFHSKETELGQRATGGASATRSCDWR
jgi:hypothetical protein